MRPYKKDTLCGDIIQQIMQPEVFQDLMFLGKKEGGKKNHKPLTVGDTRLEAFKISCFNYSN